jgi:hypothetical protein
MLGNYYDIYSLSLHLLLVDFISHSPTSWNSKNVLNIACV